MIVRRFSLIGVAAVAIILVTLLAFQTIISEFPLRINTTDAKKIRIRSKNSLPDLIGQGVLIIRRQSRR